MTTDDIRRLCEYAKDGADVLQLGIQPENVLALLDKLERYDKMHEMLTQEDAFWNGAFILHCSDTFYVASADAERITDEEFDDMYPWWQKYRYRGMIAWIARKRGREPLSSWVKMADSGRVYPKITFPLYETIRKELG